MKFQGKKLLYLDNAPIPSVKISFILKNCGEYDNILVKKPYEY